MRIAVVIPAHNESALIGRCLLSVAAAARTAGREGHVVDVYVVCDACTDATALCVVAAGYEPLVVDARNVGQARDVGARAALEDGAEWLSFTDADTEVAAEWIVDQIGLEVDVVCGTVQVADWESYGSTMASHFSRTYFDIDGHRHIHGANLGICATAYRLVGGFPALQNSEDVDLVRSLERRGASIAWSNRPRVTTSARADYRATAGFGATLAAVARLHHEHDLILLPDASRVAHPAQVAHVAERDAS